MRRRIRNALGVVAVVAGVMVPTAALAQDYPTPPSTPTAPSGGGDAPGGRGAADTTRPAGGGPTLPFTGGEIAALTVAGVGVTGAGVALLGLGRRRARAGA